MAAAKDKASRKGFSSADPMIKNVRVVPNSRKEEMVIFRDFILIRTTKPAEDNKANLAVIKMLKKRYGKNVRIISGAKGRKKVVEIE